MFSGFPELLKLIFCFPQVSFPMFPVFLDLKVVLSRWWPKNFSGFHRFGSMVIPIDTSDRDNKVGLSTTVGSNTLQSITGCQTRPLCMYVLS